jgi:hypothetical protein
MQVVAKLQAVWISAWRLVNLTEVVRGFLRVLRANARVAPYVTL